MGIIKITTNDMETGKLYVCVRTVSGEPQFPLVFDSYQTAMEFLLRTDSPCWAYWGNPESTAKAFSRAMERNVRYVNGSRPAMFLDKRTFKGYFILHFLFESFAGWIIQLEKFVEVDHDS